jgi:hypothetical protein
MRTLKKHCLSDKESMSRWAGRAKALKTAAAGSAAGRVTLEPSPLLKLPLLDVLTFAHDSSGRKVGR